VTRFLRELPPAHEWIVERYEKLQAGARRRRGEPT